MNHISSSKGKQKGNGGSKSRLLYPEVGIRDGYIVLNPSEKHPEQERVAQAIRIKKVLIDMDTNEVNFLLSYKYRDKQQEIILSRGDLRKNRIVDLSAKGLDIFDHNATTIIKHLHNQEQLAPEQKVHRTLGWGTFGDNVVFKHWNAIGLDSMYVGNLKIEPKGTFENWKNVVQGHVLGNTPLELAVLLGLSSSVVGMIGLSIALDTLFVHICGDSTQGKTTATTLAVSTQGYPSANENGLMQTWLATQNAIIGTLVGNFGLIVGLDEVSMSDAKDFSIMVYRIAGGKDKLRLNKEANMRETGKWSTTILSNGEFAITSKVNNNVGIRMRLIEFANVTWTRDASSADTIKDVVANNYGHAGPIFATSLYRLGKDKLKVLWKKWCARVLSAFPVQGQFSARIANKLAILMVTGELASEALGLSFNVNAILDFLVKNELNVQDERDLGTRALEHFLEKFTVHQRNFITSKQPLGCKGSALDNRQIFGVVSASDSAYTEVTVLSSVFEEWMKAGNFEDHKVILKSWKAKGILDCEKDRYTRKRKINSDVPVQVYCIRVKKEVKPPLRTDSINKKK